MPLGQTISCGERVVEHSAASCGLYLLRGVAEKEVLLVWTRDSLEGPVQTPLLQHKLE